MSSQPIFNVPKPVSWICLLIVAVHVARVITEPEGTRHILDLLAFRPSSFFGSNADWLINFPSLFSYGLVHAGWAHLFFNTAMLAAFATPMTRVYGPLPMLGVLVVGTIGGALGFGALHASSNVPVVGISAGVSAQMGAIFALMGRTRQGDNSRLLVLSAVWVGSAIVFGFLGGPNGQQIAWEAHIFGFLIGLAASFVLKTK